ncbi:MAG: PAS domain S-box protein [Deltaproteobacteria bacterium]|nr:PAS domain S-box protein [Deltaproteobacteria bacterium]
MQDHEKTQDQPIDELSEMRRKVAEFDAVQKSLTQSESRYREIVDKASEAIFIIQDERIKFVNRAATELTGYSKEEGLASQAIETFVHPDDRDVVNQYHIRRLQGDNAPFLYEFRFVSKDGTVKWAEMSSALIMWEGRPAGLCLAADITERKRVDEALRNSEERFRGMFERHSAVMLLIEPVGGKIVDANKAAERFYGYTMSQLRSMYIREINILPPAEVESLRLLAVKGQCNYAIFPHRLANGEIRTVEVHTSPIEHNGAFLLFSVIHDITDRKKTEEALRSSEQRFRTLFETANDAILLSDGPKFIECNSKALQIFGCEQEKDIVGHSPTEFSPDKQPDGADSTEKALKYIYAASGSGPQTFYWKHCRKDGSPFDAEVSINALTLNGNTYFLGIVRDITERKTAEEALRDTEERHRRLIEHLPQRIFIKDRNSIYLSCNGNYASDLGTTPEKIVGKDDFDFHPSELAEAYRADDRDCMSTGMVKDIEEPYLLAGEERWAHTIKAPFHDSQGRIIGVIGIFEDITERKQVELALRESEQRLGLALEGGALGLWDWNLKTGLGVWSDRTIRMLGYEVGELDAHIRTWKRAVHPDDWENVSEVLNRHLSGRLPFYEAEYRMRTKSGEWKWIQDHGKVVEYDKEGRPQRMTGTTIDVTERKKAEEELRKSEEKYRRLIENAYDIVYTTNPGGRFTFANPACVQHIRYSQEELIGRNYLEFIPEAYRRDISRFYGRQFVKKISDTYYEFPFVTKSGETRWYGQKTQLLMEKDTIVGFQSIARDITDRKKTEEALRESEGRFRGMFEKHSAVMLLIEPVTGKILDANKAAEQFYGYTKSQLLSMFIQDINVLPPEQVEATRNLILKEQRNYFIFPHRLANGKVRTVEVHSATIEQNGALQLFSIIHDITDRERLERKRLQMERKLLHTQKLESLAVMAGGIAHDFNNQLAVVLGNLELALMDLAPDSGVKPSIQNAVEAAKQSAELSRKMQVYTGNVLYSPVNLDLNEFLTSNLSQLKLGLPKNITLICESFNSLPNIKGDPEQIRSLLRNILVNACEAIGEKDGEARFSTGVMDCDTDYLSLSCPLKHPEPGRFVFLEVSDTGCGMDAETQRQLFDPFFSTKFWGRGLGMSEALGIVKSHHGAIIVDSGVGEGTTIRVLFPVLKEAHVSSVQAMDLAEPEVSATDIVTRKKTILIVEDEAGVRDLSVKRLEVLGYNTIVAVDGEEGVSVFRERLNEIDLVMLDFKMPKMNGVEAFGELIRIKPDVKVILCSGYTEDVVMQSFPGQRPAGVLHKPYNMDDLKSELDRLLGTAD